MGLEGKMNPLIIIPARLSASRLPQKPLALIGGKPLVLHVLERGLEADIGRVIVACDDEKIASIVKNAGGEVCLTDPSLPSGSDRVYAAATIIDPEEKYDVIINLQGDMPFIDPQVIKYSFEPFQNETVDIATLAVKLTDEERKKNPSIAKIAMAEGNHPEIRRALYFSRSVIPYGAITHYHHVGLYSYRREALKTFVHHPPSPLELVEKLEQLRALEAGLRIDVRIVDAVPFEVNTPEDLEESQRLVKTFRNSWADKSLA
jgi:3-deoxy-manno-octulosonate cytidylyltransferase (CMP-KDO synthetase)